MASSSSYEKDPRKSSSDQDTRALLNESGDGDAEIQSRHGRRTSRRRPWCRWLPPAAVLALTLTNILSLVALWRRRNYHQGPIYPRLRGVDPTYRWIQFQATIVHQSRYVARPSPDVDKAWEDLGVSLDELLIPTRFDREADISPDHITVELEPGNPQFVVGVEALHQMHCLNLLRKSAFHNVDYYRSRGAMEFMNEGRLLTQHVDHCIDMLRERIMCTADAGLMPYYWVRANESVSDFRRDHHCRDYRSVLAWAQRADKFPEGDGLLARTPPPGAFILDEYP